MADAKKTPTVPQLITKDTIKEICDVSDVSDISDFETFPINDCSSENDSDNSFAYHYSSCSESESDEEGKGFENLDSDELSIKESIKE